MRCRRLQNDASVVAAEAEGVGQHGLHWGMRWCRDGHDIESRIERDEPGIGRQQTVANRDRGDDRLDTACGGQGVAGQAFGRRQGRYRLAEDPADGLRFGGVIVERAGAVQVDVVDVRRRQSGVVERSPYSESRTGAFGMRARRVVGVATEAGACQDGENRPAWRRLEQKKTRALGNGHSGSLHVERRAAVRRE